ncbi:hypothetical protein SISNIDRAFT_438390 [Sistotremastrum niveocremeum HHB9708]|uniref:RRM domain-containing protein n=1 Tax=Sistotremastrum niveocremeum HHB9708 TaxID=1314777 RepID=A0A164XCA4_9AGAM|nr:hypothetical protein SISNIDRAFT_438390 [Sistotremastrum niveocremeum HHB9708]
MVSRAWGTRYDTLTATEETDNPQNSASDDDATGREKIPPASNISQNKVYETARWSDDPMDDSLRISAPNGASLDPSKLSKNRTVAADFLAAPKDRERWPHDASVFVASLPTHLEEPELKRLLLEHFNRFADVKNIKIIRDQRGGPCAFVQVEDSAQAQVLIAGRDVSIFQGRTIRCEIARAFRTLLISFRVPPTYSQNPQVSETGEDGVDASTGNVPVSVRLRRPKGSRQIQVVLNNYASKFDPTRSDISEANPADPFSGAGMLFHPLQNNEATLRELVDAFGPIEYFRPYSAPPHMGGAYPPPHDGPRAPNMQDGVWEVKWEHRDDSSFAIQTLPQIPHILVTWAHQQPYAFQRPPTQRADSFQRTPRHHNPDGYRGVEQPSPRYRSVPADYDEDEVTTPPALSPSTTFHTVPSSSNVTEAGLGPDHWNLASPQPGIFAASIVSPSSSHILNGGRGGGYSPRVIRGINKDGGLTENDFPPLEKVAKEPLRPIRNTDDEISNAMSNVHLANPRSRPQILARSISTPPADRPVGGKQTATSDFQQLEEEVPPTPDLEEFDSKTSTMSPVSPVTPGLIGTQHTDYHEKEVEYPSLHEEVETTTIFVGGLDMYGPQQWDETILKTVFEEFGEVLEVRYITPQSARAPFAFIKFATTEAKERAIQEAHNRVYGGRRIRVQARDPNALRGQWRHRGRGSYGYARRSRSRGHVFEDQMRSSYRGYDKSPNTFQPDRSQVKGSSIGESDTTSSMEQGNQSINRGRDGSFSRSTNSPVASKRSPARTDSTAVHLPQDERITTPSHAVESSPIHVSGPKASEPSAEAPSPSVVPTVPYYGQTPWVYAYPPYPYMPYGYAPQYPVPPSNAAATPAGLPSVPPTGQWPGYQPFVPFTSYAPPATNIPSQTASTTTQQSTPQPPLQPSGFIQGEQGLVPVYPPEALDTYMTNTGNKGDAQPRPPSVPAGSQTPASPQYYWGYNPAPYPYPQQVPGWTDPSAPSQPHAPTHPSPVPVPHPTYGYPSQRGGHHGPVAHDARGAAHGKPNGRRDHHHNSHYRQGYNEHHIHHPNNRISRNPAPNSHQGHATDHTFATDANTAASAHPAPHARNVAMQAGYRGGPPEGSWSWNMPQ